MKSSQLIDLLFPRRCPVCDDIVIPKGRKICPECLKKLSFVTNPVCKKCGKKVISNDVEYCFDCVRHKRSFESGRALIHYDETAKASMVNIKYKNKREYLDFYGEAMAVRYEKWILSMKPDVLVPVPVHPTRQRERGFNQAHILACRIGERAAIPVETGMLLRNKKTIPQKGLNPSQRLKNLEEAFVPGNVTSGVETVLLIDDIYTTGSTIEACTRALKRAGIKKIYFLTICIGLGQ